MEGFKNTTRMKTFGDEAPQAYAKGGSVKPMAKAPAKAPTKKADAKYPVKRKDGDLSNMTPAERRASMEQTSRAMTPAQTRSLQALKSAKDAAPKQGPLIKPARQMTPAERRMNQMDRPTNNMGAEAYKGGGKVGGSKVPFAVKKVMRKAEGGAVSQIPEMPNQSAPPPPMISDTGSGYVPQPSGGFDPAQVKRMQELAAMMGNMPSPPIQEPTPQSVFGKIDPSVFGKINPDLYGTSPSPMPEMPNEPMMPSAPQLNRGVPEDLTWYNNMVKKTLAARDAQNAAQRADQAATAQAQQEMAAQAQMDRGLGLDLGSRRNLSPSYGRNPYLPRS